MFCLSFCQFASQDSALAIATADRARQPQSAEESGQQHHAGAEQLRHAQRHRRDVSHRAPAVAIQKLGYDIALSFVKIAGQVLWTGFVLSVRFTGSVSVQLRIYLQRGIVPIERTDVNRFNATQFQ